MSTSGDDRKKYAETARVYLIISVLCAVFGAVYELFSHKVYSFYMIFAFMIPLLGGFVPSLIMYALNVKTVQSGCGGRTVSVGNRHAHHRQYNKGYT